jgi:hypothetical protein
MNIEFSGVKHTVHSNKARAAQKLTSMRRKFFQNCITVLDSFFKQLVIAEFLTTHDVVR